MVLSGRWNRNLRRGRRWSIGSTPAGCVHGDRIRSITLTLTGGRRRLVASTQAGRAFALTRSGSSSPSTGGHTQVFFTVVLIVNRHTFNNFLLCLMGLRLLLLLFWDFGSMCVYFLMRQRDANVTDSQPMALQPVALHGPRRLAWRPTTSKHKERMLSRCLYLHLKQRKNGTLVFLLYLEN